VAIRCPHKPCDDAAMVECDWGLAEEPASFDPGAWRGEPIYSDEPGDVPAVGLARAQGYFPAHEAPLWCFIPAIWPSAARAWVHDQRVRHLTRTCDGGPLERLLWSTADYARHEEDTNSFLAELGLPPRPAGRIWLLRAPAPYATPQDILDQIWAGWQASGGPAMATPGFVEYAQDRVREIF
jgi:hypothetical protein